MPWPCLLGVVPPEAECFQTRSASSMLEAALATGSTDVLCQVLSGAGGVGKTQVAARYARACWTAGNLDLLLWLTGGNRESVIAAYARAAVLVGVPSAEDTETTARGFVSWLASTQRTWLVVIDDLADPGDLKGLWPPSHTTGRTVVTTRRRDAVLTGTRRRRVEVEGFTSHEAEAYITAKLAAHGRSDADGQIAGLARDMGFLPVGLAQAMAYLIDTGLDCVQYRQRWADRRRTLPKLVPQPGSLPDDQSLALAAIWSLSVQRANTLEPVGLAGPMLDLISLLDPHGIPSDVLTAPPVLTYLAAYRAQIRDGDSDADLEAADALATLARLSLCTRESDELFSMVRVHALVQRATRENIASQQFAAVVQAAADALVYAWPEVERDAKLSLALRSNVAKLDANGQKSLRESAVHPVLFRAGLSLGSTGLYTEAAAYFASLCESSAAHLGPDHPDSLAARYQFVHWQTPSVDAEDTIAACEELIADQVRVLGPDHPDTLATRRLHAFWLGFWDPRDASAALEELLDHCQRVLGPDHLDTLTTRKELAHQLGLTGLRGAAIFAFEELLTDQERVLGPDHPETLDTRFRICSHLAATGDTAATNIALGQLLADQERVLGPDHRKTMAVRAHLAVASVMAVDAAAGVAQLESVVADLIRTLGPNDHDTLHVRGKLARALGEVGDEASAITAYEDLIADLTRVLGYENPHTREARDELTRWQRHKPAGGQSIHEGCL